MWPERLNLRPERLDLRPDGPGGGGDERMNERTDERTDGRTKVPLCSTGLRPLWGRCPKRNEEIERKPPESNFLLQMDRLTDLPADKPFF